ncbi:hypothetical protein ABMA28_011526 [Loxostege sticticalis]|uniref:Reverse transcriptase RNase H-like domain-containing protein n=1 Tax=Loxostege sticticalis TaxID=481309 RepID=A0ABD0S6J5_LOXSC
MEKTGESEKSESVAPDGGQARSDSSESESSSSSSEDEVFASPPPNKRQAISSQQQPRTSKYKHQTELTIWKGASATNLTCTLKQAQSLLGLLNFANLTVPGGRLHCRRMQLFLREFQEGRVRERRALPQTVHQDLSWWLRAVENSSKPLRRKEVTHFLTTDAADAGWGAQLNGMFLSGKWTSLQERWHSNVKEMYAVYGAILDQQNALRGAHILIQSDNRTLVAYIRNEGGTRSLALLNLTTRLLNLTEQLELTLSACYLPGNLNGIADRLSRGRAVPEWHLLPQATEAIFSRWGVPDVDLFASRVTAVVPNYVSLDSTDGCAIFCDAFSRTWDYQLGWVFPPPNLIPQVLAHLNRSKGTFIIIAPQWPQCFWCPDLRARALETPLPIEDLRRTLIDQTTGRCPPQVDKLSLLAWKVGGGQSRYPTGAQQKENC